jgi:hypothetical protein
MALYNSVDEIRFLALAILSPLPLYHCLTRKTPARVKSVKKARSEDMLRAGKGKGRLQKRRSESRDLH